MSDLKEKDSANTKKRGRKPYGKHSNVVLQTRGRPKKEREANNMTDYRIVTMCEECGKKLPEPMWYPTDFVVICYECYVKAKKKGGFSK